MPKRIQRKRTKGYRLPEGAVYVGRPTIYGNPYPANGDNAEAVRKFDLWLDRNPELKWRARRELRGKDLACWCSLLLPDGHCHADIWLRVAAEENGDWLTPLLDAQYSLRLAFGVRPTTVDAP